jgi:DNA-binding transcriptional MerR regulator
MIYKINVDYAKISLEKLADKLNKSGDLLIFQEVVYFKTMDQNCTVKQIKHFIKIAGSNDSIIQEITEDTYRNEPDMVQPWLGEYFTELHRQQMEEQHQEELRAMRDQLQAAIDIVTGKVKIKYKEKDGGSNGGNN